MESKDVNKFLKKDFWGYMYQGGIHPGQLTGTSFDLAPAGHSNTNSTEKAYVDTMSKAADKINVAIKRGMHIG